MPRHLRAALILGVAAAGACATEPEPGLARGEAVFDTCVPCHGGNGEGNQELGAPGIAGLPQWYVEEQLRSFTNNWRGAHPQDTVGIRMKSMVQTLDLEGDLESVAEYVASLPRHEVVDALEGDAQAGAASYGVCIACHGPEGAGNPDLHAPPLTGHSDWYLASQLRKFRAGWRGAHPDDIWGATMRPNALALSDQDILNVVAYIETLR